MSTSAKKRNRAKRATCRAAGASSLHRVCSALESLEWHLSDGGELHRAAEVLYDTKGTTSALCSLLRCRELVKEIKEQNVQAQPRAEKEA